MPPVGGDHGGKVIVAHVANTSEVRLDVVAVLADRFGLREGLGIERATDLLLMFGSSATYLTLRRYGWSDDDYVAWATDTLSKQLLARPGRAKSGEPSRRLL